MIQKLTLDDVVAILGNTPEQCVFDWKRNISWDNDDRKSEIVKDIAAVANATTTSPGFIFYGVDPGRPDAIVWVSGSYDDAAVQQLLANKLDPPVDFVYYEVTHGPRVVGVVHIPPSMKRPHIVARDFGKLRQGQILVRSGSSTKGVSWRELFEMFYGEHSPYLAEVLRRHGIEAMQLQARAAWMRELREYERDIERDMHDLTGI